jgi:hypothetical protein
MDAPLEKEVDGRPFAVCIDLNLPETVERSFEDRMRELHEAALEHLGPASVEKPDRSAPSASRTTPGTGLATRRRGRRRASSSSRRTRPRRCRTMSVRC